MRSFSKYVTDCHELERGSPNLFIQAGFSSHCFIVNISKVNSMHVDWHANC